MSRYPVCVGRTSFPLRAPALPAERASRPLPTSPTFVLLDGPPYANGALHLGHVLNKHLKDASARAAEALGEVVRWQPGWDCHGLPVELKLERAGHARHPALPFVQAARAYAQSQVDAQAQTFQAQGLCASWEAPYTTMQPAQQAATLRVFADLVERHQVVVRDRPTWWCAHCQSTLAAAEHEPGQRPTTACVVPFALDDGAVLLTWTTTPWTVPYHQGVVVHPEASYVRVHTLHGDAWVSEAAWTQGLAWYAPLREGAVVERQPGHALVGQAYTTPWGQAGVVRAHASVAPDAGTGLLHAVAAFGLDDAALGEAWDWPLSQAMDETGTLRAARGAWVGHDGLTLPQADAAALAVLRGSPWHAEEACTLEHPHCWRHHVPLLVRPSRQVYLPLQALKDKAMDALDAVAFVPAAGRERLREALRHRPDWCVSRQRTWGVPLALFLDPTTQQPVPEAAAWMRTVADRVAVEGVEAWWQDPYAGLPEVARQFVRVDDVLDVWFDSAAVAQTTLHGPADLVVEGHDQHRGWFQASLWLAMALDRPSPFRRVVTHGFVLREDGQKFAKSSPEERVTSAQAMPDWSTCSPDVVRAWALNAEAGSDRRWQAEPVQTAQDLVNRWRNSVRFGLANRLPEGAEPLPGGHLLTFDRWVVHQAQHLACAALTAARDGHYEQAVQHTQTLANEVLSKTAYAVWKDRLYCAEPEGLERRSAQTALTYAWQALVAVLRAMAPQMLAEASTHGALPWGLPPAVPALTAEETAQVSAALTARAQVGVLWDEATRGDRMRAAMVVPEPCPVAWAEVVGVSVLHRGPHPAVSPAEGEVCPRCRWTVVAMAHDCPRCATRGVDVPLNGGSEPAT